MLQFIIPASFSSTCQYGEYLSEDLICCSKCFPGTTQHRIHIAVPIWNSESSNHPQLNPSFLFHKKQVAVLPHSFVQPKKLLKFK